MNTQNYTRRIITIAGRSGIAIASDNKPVDGKSGTIYSYSGKDTHIACLKALNAQLEKVPVEQLEKTVVFLLPSNISFLSFEDTRTHWITYGYRKCDINLTTGEVMSRYNVKTQTYVQPEKIDEELLAEVRVMHSLISEKKHNIDLFSQYKTVDGRQVRALHSNQFNAFITATWQNLERYAPKNTLSLTYA